ncbi:Xaa-Pro aminopeptidase [Hypnocyclicus thermotrophus]|uniref:Xaa-Pro aminopeptidase n=1 Tax=Hypnocyclicus thermotrophus TaxID=1627895 RepID=A0AA46DYN0_9FUSO|nr:aminopeptidase P family protein [Hypnocyclicus thermotrophus]TDT70546.1 Xaa-Pro aminopeptidase [Hypnocyclicus thermotrophus]
MLNKILNEKNIDAILISDKYSLRYFTGFTGTTGIALAVKEKKFFFTDFRYVEQAKIEVEKNGYEIVVIERKASDKVVEYIKNAKVKKLGIEDNSMSLAIFNEYKNKLEEVDFEMLGNSLQLARMIKRDDEIETIKKAVEIADKAFAKVLPLIKEGVTEKYLATELEYEMKKLGAESISFETIVASNYRSAMPHGVASDKKIKKEGFIKFDFGAYYNGYVSDMTRTIYFGENISDKHKEIYNIVLEAQLKAIKAVKAGIKVSELDKIARDYITEKGYGNKFGHGLGHGIGVEIHEYPYVNSKSDIILKEGMVITIEPGIYIEGFGGVRIEDDVVVKKDHGEVLNKTSKELLIIKK